MFPRIRLSASAASQRPSGLKKTFVLTSPSPLSVRIFLPPGRSQRMRSGPNPIDTSTFPSGRNATPFAEWSNAARVSRDLRLLSSQSLTVPSRLAVASWPPSRLKASELMLFRCPGSSGVVSRPLATSHSRTIKPAVARVESSRLSASALLPMLSFGNSRTTAPVFSSMIRAANPSISARRPPSRVNASAVTPRLSTSLTCSRTAQVIVSQRTSP